MRLGLRGTVAGGRRSSVRRQGPPWIPGGWAGRGHRGTGPSRGRGLPVWLLTGYHLLGTQEAPPRVWIHLTSGQPCRPRLLAQAVAGVPSPPLCRARASSPHRAMGMGTVRKGHHELTAEGRCPQCGRQNVSPRDRPSPRGHAGVAPRGVDFPGGIRAPGRNDILRKPGGSLPGAQAGPQDAVPVPVCARPFHGQRPVLRTTAPACPSRSYYM